MCGQKIGPRGPWGDAFVIRIPMHQPFSPFPTRRRFGSQSIGKRNVFGWEMLARRNFRSQGTLGRCFCRKKTNASAFFAFSHEAPIRWSKYRQRLTQRALVCPRPRASKARVVRPPKSQSADSMGAGDAQGLIGPRASPNRTPPQVKRSGARLVRNQTGTAFIIKTIKKHI